MRKILAGVVFVIMVSNMFLTGCNGKKNTLESKIINYADDNYIDESIEINLSDFTSFDWEKAIVFRTPVSSKEIEIALGIEYKKDLDLISGIIFINDNKVVYEELIGASSERIPFQIYPHQNIAQNLNYRIFFPDNALFECRGVKYDHNSRNYRLYPISDQ